MRWWRRKRKPTVRFQLLDRTGLTVIDMTDLEMYLIAKYGGSTIDVFNGTFYIRLTLVGGRAR